MDNAFPIFRHWVPEWLVKLLLFVVILPSLVLFFLPLANINAAAGYYGCEPSDIQFAVVLFYAGYVGFYSLERRFFSFLATKEYFIVFTVLQILATLVCFQTRELSILFPIRFFQGMLFSCTVNLSLSLMFTRLHSERAREISFSVFFGMLLCALPFNNLVTADLIDNFDFNIVYRVSMFSFLPGLALLILTMNNIRLNIRFPLYQLDWESFLLYSIILCLTGYVLIFGQEYYWLEDQRIRYSTLSLAFTMLIYIIRQKRMKRPYLDLGIFKFRNFKVGVFVLLIMYICRFASGLTNIFFATVLRFDPMHVSYINLLNLGGLITGVIISCCLILQKRSIRVIWMSGFTILLAFHVTMFFLFDTQANENNFYVPLFLQGLGVGFLMVPTIVYSLSSVPVSIGASASAFCLAIRYLGFCLSIAIINYSELWERGRHYSAFQDHLSRLDPGVKQIFSQQPSHLLEKGLLQSQTLKATNKLLVTSLNGQTQIRFSMDYYEIMSWLLVGTLLMIAMFPRLNKTVAYLKSRRLSPS